MDHLGILMAVMIKIKWIEIIDKVIPLSTTRKVRLTIGPRVAEMIWNALGCVTRLYMFPEFMHSKKVTRLFGNGIQ